VRSNAQQDQGQNSLREYPPQKEEGTGAKTNVYKANQNQIHSKQSFADCHDPFTVALKREGSCFSFDSLICSSFRAFFAGVHVCLSRVWGGRVRNDGPIVSESDERMIKSRLLLLFCHDINHATMCCGTQNCENLSISVLIGYLLKWRVLALFPQHD
jgi:hypothetical protein